MAFEISGDYFESCNCQVSCPCIFLAPASEDRCHVFLAWRITSGEKDGVDVAGLSVALAVDSPKVMTDGGWRVALYLDERATPRQAEALQAIFSGAAGGHLGALAPLIGEVTGVHSAAISFDGEGEADGRSISVGDALQMRVEQTVGMDGKSPTVISNPPFGAVAQPLRQAKSTSVAYSGPWSVQFDGRNAFVTEFAYAG